MAFTVVTQNMDWSDVDFLNELTSAQRIREEACGIGLTAVVGIGEDVQDHNGVIGILQERTAGEFGLWWRGWLDPTPADYDGEAALPADMTLNAFLTAAGIPSGFRRAMTPPTDWTDYNDAAFAYGVIQADDIIGPWLFADLQAVYGVLTRQRLTVNGTGGGACIGQGLDVAGWAAAKAAAEADYGGGIAPLGAYTYGLNRDDVNFDAELARATTKFTAPNVPIGQERDVTWYVRPEKIIDPFAAIHVFNPQGDVRFDTNPIIEGELNLMLFERHDGTAGDGTFTSNGTIGSVAAATMPANWCAEPADSRTLGWQADHMNQLAATVDWLFADQI